MRALLEVLRAHNHPVAIVTKGSLIERDIDILSDMAARGLARVGISVTTLDRNVARAMEPRVPPPGATDRNHSPIEQSRNWRAGYGLAGCTRPDVS